jgi:hypothetical protein
MYWDGQEWQQDEKGTSAAALAPLPGTEDVVGHAAQQAPGAYVYKNPVLYAFGGLFSHRWSFSSWAAAGLRAPG